MSPLARCADDFIARLATSTGAPALSALDGETVLGERAMLAQLRIPGRVSAGGGCRLYDARGGAVALNLARTEDRDMLPALFESADFDPSDRDALTTLMRRSDAQALVVRGRSMGLAIAMENESRAIDALPCTELCAGGERRTALPRMPRVLDLSALWAGPLAAHLLWLAGAEVIKVESRSRPDAMRTANDAFFALLNQGKASVQLDFSSAEDRHALRRLISSCDIVIEAARPRALLQLGIDAASCVRSTPGIVWITITGHGALGEAANGIGFGDDCGVAGGLTAALRAASGRCGFVGDAIADPLTGLAAALAAWQAWLSKRAVRIGVSMSDVVADCLTDARRKAEPELLAALVEWSAAVGKPFAAVTRRRIGAVAELGVDTDRYLSSQ